MRITPYLWIAPFISFFLGYYLISKLYARAIAIKTPAVIGLSLDKTIKILSDHNLNARILAEKEDTDLPSGTVINQNPAPGKNIKTNQSVFLVLSTKPRTAKTPNLANKALSDIEADLAHQGIALESHAVSSVYPKNHCIGQSPLPGTDLENKKIAVYVAAGSKKPIIMPNFTQKPVYEVTQFLHRHGMICHVFHTHPQSEEHDCFSCLVTDQRPLAGSLIELSEEKPLYVQIQAQG